MGIIGTVSVEHFNILKQGSRHKIIFKYLLRLSIFRISYFLQSEFSVCFDVIGYSTVL